MNNENLPVEVKKNNIFSRIITFLKNKFGKKQIINSDKINEPMPSKQNSIREAYKVDNIDSINSKIIRENNQKRKMEEIIQLIEKEPSVLNELDVNKLEIIDEYYKRKIIELKRKLAE